MKKQLSLASILLAACTPMRLGVIPYPDEVLTARKVEIVWPLDDGHYLAVSGEYSCRIDIEPLKVQEGEMLICRWNKYKESR